MAKRKTKATYHCGRKTKAGQVFNANHNTNKKTRAGQNHIDHEQTEKNLLYRIENNKLIRCESYDAIEFEKKRYKELFLESLEAKNERYRQQRHKERCRSIDDLYRDPKKCPFEMILQIGNAKDGMSQEEKAELSRNVNLEFIREMYRLYGKNLIPLNCSGHHDEACVHWHYRAVFVYKGKDGLEPNQTKALESLGIERPDKDRPIGRNNNPLMTFTAEARELYYEICERYGLEIDREVQNPSQKHRETLEYKCQQLGQKADKEADRYNENKRRADKEEIRAVQNSELAEKLMTKKVKRNKDGTITIGLRQYQEATSLMQETRKILDSEVYGQTERKEMQRATESMNREKERYKTAADRIEEQVEQRAEEIAQSRTRSEKYRIEKLEKELTAERNDKSYICDMLKKFLSKEVLERFEQFSGVMLHDQQQTRRQRR